MDTLSTDVAELSTWTGDGGLVSPFVRAERIVGDGVGWGGGANGK
jgi:hypothetical protein